MRLASMLVVILLAAACGRTSVEEAGRPSPTPQGEARSATDGTAAPDSPATDGSDVADGSRGSGPGAGPSDTPAPTRAPAAPSSADQGPVGDNALTYLRAAHRRLVIEIDAASSREPNTATLDHVRSQLGDVLSKPDGISATVKTFEPSKSRYTTDDIADLERRHRDTWSEGSTASLYVLFLNGRYAPDDSVLGLAYSASTFVIFKDAIASASTVLVPASAIERSVTLHEIGHILRLINIGYRSPRDHEDPQHPNHSRNRASVMYWAVDSDLISSLFSGPPPDTFDADDRADLADLKAGRL